MPAVANLNRRKRCQASEHVWGMQRQRLASGMEDGASQAQAFMKVRAAGVHGPVPIAAR